MIIPHLVLGGPGTGKTEHLVNIAIEAISKGTPPDRIAFVAFSKVAAAEAMIRIKQSSQLTEGDLPHFRTLHSLCFRGLGLRRGDVLDGPALEELQALTGERYGRDPTVGEASPFEVEQLARAARRSVDPIVLGQKFDLEPFRMRRAIIAYKRFKEDKGLVDYTDMLEQYIDEGSPVDVDLAIIDEAQDLTPLQWAVAHRAFVNVPRVIVAGDDDQAIHTWAGADPQPLLDHKGEITILTQSHRLPRQVHSISQRIITQIKKRQRKKTVPADREGSVKWYQNPTEVDMSEGTWLLLARARFQLKELAVLARGAGVVYSLRGRSSVNKQLLSAAIDYEKNKSNKDIMWHDALTKFPLEEREYLLACRRRGESLTAVPRVSIDTVHGSKGRQADNVLLITDLTLRVQKAQDTDPDAELRVLYVGLTRARERLHIIAPRGPWAWQL